MNVPRQSDSCACGIRQPSMTVDKKGSQSCGFQGQITGALSVSTNPCERGVVNQKLSPRHATSAGQLTIPVGGCESYRPAEAAGRERTTPQGGVKRDKLDGGLHYLRAHWRNSNRRRQRDSRQMTEAVRDTAKLKVFISYSRRDSSALAEELVTGLEVVGFDAFLDRQDVAGGEDWELRLLRLIQTASTVVSLLSPEAVSPTAAGGKWTKRRNLQETDSCRRQAGQRLRSAREPAQPELHLLHRRPLVCSIARTACRCLRTDLAWIRDHTRLGEVAVRWHERGRQDALLLRGGELAMAQDWVAGRRPDAPEITDVQRSYIAASADAESARSNLERQQLEEMAKAQTARAAALAEREQAVTTLARRTLLGGIGAATFSLATGGLGYWAWRAEGRFRQERARADEAHEKSLEAAILKEANGTRF